MSMSASCRLVNNTGGPIKFASILKVNDDATWDIEPPAGTLLDEGQACLVSMGNSSVFFAPKGVGFSAVFVGRNLDMGTVKLDDPAVGKHHFTTSGPFQFHVDELGGNSYAVTIS